MHAKKKQNRQIRKICKYLCLTVNRLARTRYGPFSLGKVRAGGVAQVEIPKEFMRRLEDGTAAGSVNSGGSGSSRRRVGPGPGTGRRREAEAGEALSSYQATSFSGREGVGVAGSRRSGGGGGGDIERADGDDAGTGRGASSGARGVVRGSRGRGKGNGTGGERIRKGVGAPMSRGDRYARSREQRRVL